MKYLKTFENLRDDWENETDPDKKIAIALQAMDKLKRMETNFEVGDYVKYREENRKGREFDNDFFIVYQIKGSDRPKKYRDKIQDGYLTNVRTDETDYFSFQNFEKCTEEEIERIKLNIKANKYNL